MRRGEEAISEFGRDGRVDYGDGLENRCGRKVTGGSNPSPSARAVICHLCHLYRNSGKPAVNGEMPEWTNGTAC